MPTDQSRGRQFLSPLDALAEKVSREPGSSQNFPVFPVFDALRGCVRGRLPKYVPQKSIISGISTDSRTGNSFRDEREILTQFQGMHINETGKVTYTPDLAKQYASLSSFRHGRVECCVRCCRLIMKI